MKNISIIILTLNEEAYIKNTLLSLRNCREIIIVDGGSKDRTIEFVKKICPASKVYITKMNIPDSRNLGANVAKGDILIYLDADTIVSPDVVKQIIYKMDEKTIIGGTVSLSPYDGKLLYKLYYAMSNIVLYLLSLCRFPCRPLIQGSILFMSKKGFVSTGGFWRFNIAEDSEIALRLSKLGRFVFLKKAIAYTSTRRLQKWGFWKWFKVCAVNLLLIMAGREPVFTNWEPIN